MTLNSDVSKVAKDYCTSYSPANCVGMFGIGSFSKWCSRAKAPIGKLLAG